MIHNILKYFFARFRKKIGLDNNSALLLDLLDDDKNFTDEVRYKLLLKSEQIKKEHEWPQELKELLNHTEYLLLSIPYQEKYREELHTFFNNNIDNSLINHFYSIYKDYPQLFFKKTEILKQEYFCSNTNSNEPHSIVPSTGHKTVRIDYGIFYNEYNKSLWKRMSLEEECLYKLLYDKIKTLGEYFFIWGDTQIEVKNPQYNILDTNTFRHIYQAMILTHYRIDAALVDSSFYDELKRQLRTRNIEFENVKGVIDEIYSEFQRFIEKHKQHEVSFPFNRLENIDQVSDFNSPIPLVQDELIEKYEGDGKELLQQVLSIKPSINFNGELEAGEENTSYKVRNFCRVLNNLYYYDPLLGIDNTYENWLEMMGRKKTTQKLSTQDAYIEWRRLTEKDNREDEARREIIENMKKLLFHANQLVHQYEVKSLMSE